MSEEQVSKRLDEGHTPQSGAKAEPIPTPGHGHTSSTEAPKLNNPPKGGTSVKSPSKDK